MEPTPPQAPQPGQRSLAAIIFTDAVSFSARMRTDEENTMRLLRQDFEAMREICLDHQGAVLKSTGDGLLLHFSSAVQAVACALAIQRSFAERAKNRPEEELLTHRVGIHLGDIFVDNQDVMGDGVNFAARLQAEAEPGGICISQTVYDVVRNKLALQVTRLGPRELKNISKAVPIYKLLLEATEMETTDSTPPYEAQGTRNPFKSLQSLSLAQKGVAMVALGALLLVIGVYSLNAWHEHQAARAKAMAHHEELIGLMEPEEAGEAAFQPDRKSRTLAEWRNELRENRSRAMAEYKFSELAAGLKDPKSPVAGKPEAQVRAQTLQRIQALFHWMNSALQKYNRENPLVVRELTGTSPKEIKVYVGADRRLYYAEGGAIRQRDWTDLRPTVLAAIMAVTILESDPLPPRETIQGALAFASFYNLPELPTALKQGRVHRLRN